MGAEGAMDYLYTEVVNQVTRSYSAGGADGVAPDDADRELTWRKLEELGFKVGYRLIERCTSRAQAEGRKEPFAEGDHMGAVKFICKDLWSSLFRKVRALCGAKEGWGGQARVGEVGG